MHWDNFHFFIWEIRNFHGECVEQIAGSFFYQLERKKWWTGTSIVFSEKAGHSSRLCSSDSGPDFCLTLVAWASNQAFVKLWPVSYSLLRELVLSLESGRVVRSQRILD